MSAYSEWKYGLITDQEYAYECRKEEAELEELENEWEEDFEDDEIDEF